ncbi:hypothetical protein [Streptacidiphilus neutrinimicus]|uniref:hypothetical protein n=1 Tax=Streptacidiphilus neutrinimicus TaxID=105420 RepID=UPI0005A644E8|nr:hypothetical protein [Streptacidiphilus neutrinimicus]
MIVQLSCSCPATSGRRRCGWRRPWPDRAARPPPACRLAPANAHVRAARLFAQELPPLDLENHRAGILLHVGLLGLGQVTEAVGRTEEQLTTCFTPEGVELFHCLVVRFAHPPDEPAS